MQLQRLRTRLWSGRLILLDSNSSFQHVPKAFADDSADTHGKLHSNLGVYLERPCNPTPGYFPWSRRLDPINSEDDFWLHERLRNHTSLYQSGVALLGDFIIDIADHHHVLTEHLSDRPIPVFSPASGRLPANPEYRIVGRGGVARIIRPSDELDDFNVFSNPKAKRQMQTLERRYLDARANAVSLVRINVSLAIRNALDRLQNFREEKRAA
ncbi:hypothetical protein AJ87_09145 [Rhizobium yanglingense]|nr:hypothetical protein AJ87_09145 [Rhizobium yanglingense]